MVESIDRSQIQMSVVKLNNVTKKFGNFVAVDNASFDLEKGRILSLLGPSGCGKTTTLRMIAGFENPSEGDILINGQSMLGKRPYERNVGLLFQDYALFPHMSVEQNIGYGLKRRNYQRSRISNRVAEMLELVKLTGFENRKPLQLSGGQQQRVALARALATSPEVVLLDEPLSALDAKLRQELRFELKQILSAVSATTIIVTHDQEEAMSLGDILMVMNEGRIEQEGTPTEVYRNPRTKFVAEFVGRSNWFSGKMGEVNGKGFCEFTIAKGLSFLVPQPEVAASEYEVCIRPERVQLNSVSENSETTQIENHMAGTVSNAAHLGADIHLVVELDTGEAITVSEQFTGQKMEESGSRINISFRPEDCIVIACKK